MKGCAGRMRGYGCIRAPRSGRRGRERGVDILRQGRRRARAMTSALTRADDVSGVRPRPRKVVYLSPRMTRTWMTMKYAQALADGGAQVKVFGEDTEAAESREGLVKSDVVFARFARRWYLPFVWRWRWLARLRVPLPPLRLVRSLVRER